jgi:hypothetical protein
MAMLRTTVATMIIGLAILVGAVIVPANAEGLPERYARPSEAPTSERGVWFSGYDVVKDARYVFDGVIVAFNGDMSRDGFALRVYGSHLDFDRNPGDGREWQGDVMLGYLFHRSHVSGGIYVGADYQNVKLKPDDPTEKVRGTEIGFKVAGDVSTDREMPYYFSLHANYSTAFETYWARARAGLTRHKVAFGAEGIAFGDEGFDAQRLGGFVMFDLNLLPNRPIEVTLSAGHQFVSDTKSGTTGGIGGSEGTYGSVVFSLTF